MDQRVYPNRYSIDLRAFFCTFARIALSAHVRRDPAPLESPHSKAMPEPDRLGLCRRDSRIPPAAMQPLPCSLMNGGALSIKFRDTSIARTENPHFEGLQIEPCLLGNASTSEMSLLMVTFFAPPNSTPFERIEHSPCSRHTSDLNARRTPI